MIEMLKAAKAAKPAVARLTTQQKNAALEAMADALLQQQDAILLANQADMDAVNAACERASRAGIKMYQWHHELDLPDGFQFGGVRERCAAECAYDQSHRHSLRSEDSRCAAEISVPGYVRL